jgi:hypothetical protein
MCNVPKHHVTRGREHTGFVDSANRLRAERGGAACVTRVTGGVMPPAGAMMGAMAARAASLLAFSWTCRGVRLVRRRGLKTSALGDFPVVYYTSRSATFRLVRTIAYQPLTQLADVLVLLGFFASQLCIGCQLFSHHNNSGFQLFFRCKLAVCIDICNSQSNRRKVGK